MSKVQKRAIKRSDLIKVLAERIRDDRFISTVHAKERQSQRSITLPQIKYVLSHGFHEKRKDQFDEVFKAWNYAVRGKTFDGIDLRVIVSFDEVDDLLIITAFEVAKGK